MFKQSKNYKFDHHYSLQNNNNNKNTRYSLYAVTNKLREDEPGCGLIRLGPAF